MTTTEFCARYPFLYHMAEHDAWPSILKHGLLSSEEIVGRSKDLSPETKRRLLTERRPQKVEVFDGFGNRFVLRDQKPLTKGALEKCLEDMVPVEWISLLNSKVFFWLSSERLDRLLRARAYRNEKQLVLKLKTSTVMENHHRNIRICPINSGSTIYRPIHRGRSTFSTLSAYPFEVYEKKRPAKDVVVELTISGLLPDIANHCVGAEIWFKERCIEKIL